MGAPSAELRVSLTISGAVSLGAYEGGVLAAVVGCLQELAPRWPVHIDAMGGASAGSITALLTARTLLGGLDPIDVMHKAWVDAPSLQKLERGAKSAPLTMDALTQLAMDILSQPGDPARAQPGPIKVHMALALLRGLTYSIPDLVAGTTIDAVTHLDWGEFEFRSGDIGEYVSPKGDSAVDVALASGANALGFPPYLLDRSDHRQEYSDNGVGGVPPDGRMWYTDGGTIDNEPLGRTLEIANKLDAADPPGHRLHLLIHPHPTAPSPTDPWATEKAPPGEWTRALMRVEQIQRTQSLSEDLRRLERTNSRLAWRTQFDGWLDNLRAAVPQDARPQLDGELRRLLDEIDQGHQQMSEAAGAARLRSKAAANVEDPLDRVLDEITGLGGKSPATVSVISPAELARQEHVTVEELLAGEFLFHFGGFADDSLRQHDFAVGYQSALLWLDGGGLSAAGIDPVALKEAIDRVRCRQPVRPPVEVSRGARRRIRGLGLRVARTVVRDLWQWKPWRGTSGAK